MAEHWLKTLGSKLLDTGAAYLKQVRLVQELQRLPAEQARDKFLNHVRELSAGARAGFALTLASLASNERQADARRFLEMLRAALDDPAAWRSGEAAPEPAQLRSSPPSPPSPPSLLPGAPATLDEDLQRMDAWEALGDAARPPAIEQYVAQLDDAQVEAFRANMDQALRNVALNIADHRENEARYAAGRFIEDQHAYRLGRLAGRPPDENWLAELRNYEKHQSSFEAMRDYLGGVLQKRRRPPPPPAPARPAAAAPAAARTRSGPERTAAKPPAAPKAAKTAPQGDLSPQIQAMRQMLAQELASGRIQADRVPAYQRVLDKLDGVLQARERGDIDAAAAEARTSELMADFMRYVADPGTASTRATPRGREVLRHAGALKTAVLREAAKNPPTETADLLGSILGDVTRAQTEAAGARDDAALAALESELLRPAARAWHELMLVRHAVLARPQWQTNEGTRSVNTLFYSGAADLEPLVEQVAAAKRLQVEERRRLQSPGQVRWDALNACHVALFDFRRAPDLDELAVRAPKRARELTGTAYELGLALALGKPVVVLATPGEALPFDIDVGSLLVDGADDDAPALDQALDEAFYRPQRETRENAIPATLDELDRLTRGHARRAQIEGMGWLAAGLRQDPAGFVKAVRQTLRTLEQPQWQLLRPAWPGVYPDPAAPPRCFHVMPYRPQWAGEVCEAARKACTARGLQYRVGKEAEDGCIIRAIWDDLCRAGTVLVELAGGNLNVMIELGIAHALGRPVLAVQRLGGHDLRPPHIEKLRVHMYETAAQLEELLMRRLRA